MPGAWWSNDTPISGSGVENLSVDNTGTMAANIVTFYNASHCWIRGIRGINPHNHHVEFWQSAHNTVRDSYFWGTQNNVEESYGIEGYLGSDNLIENNIFHHISNPMLYAQTQGDVAAYNYSFDDRFGDGTWAMQSSFTHAAGTNYLLFEGNDGYGMMLEDIHGPAHFVTAFRNHWVGFEAGNQFQTLPIYIQAFSRYANVIGNVLGTSGFHTNYLSKAGDKVDAKLCYHSIYSVGWGGNCITAPSRGVIDDPISYTTLLRWGNYDTVSNSNKFVASEVPSGLAMYANPVPGSQNLPPSFYLNAKPSWWGSVAWPPIGPDVTSGNLANGAGHANKIPARLCYESLRADGSNPYKVFNASACYPEPANPKPPTKVQATAH